MSPDKIIFEICFWNMHFVHLTPAAEFERNKMKKREQRIHKHPMSFNHLCCIHCCGVHRWNSTSKSWSKIFACPTLSFQCITVLLTKRWEFAMVQSRSHLQCSTFNLFVQITEAQSKRKSTWFTKSIVEKLFLFSFPFYTLATLVALRLRISFE